MQTCSLIIYHFNSPNNFDVGSTSAPALPQIPRFSTPRASTASSATLSPRRPLIVYNSSSASASNPNNIYGSRINNGTSIISNNDHYYPRTQDPLYNSNNIGGGGYGGSSSSSSSPASTSTTNIPPQPFPAHPPVTRYPPKKTQYTNNPNYKPPSKKSKSSANFVSLHSISLIFTLFFFLFFLIVKLHKRILSFHHQKYNITSYITPSRNFTNNFRNKSFSLFGIKSSWIGKY